MPPHRAIYHLRIRRLILTLATVGMGYGALRATCPSTVKANPPRHEAPTPQAQPQPAINPQVITQCRLPSRHAGEDFSIQTLAYADNAEPRQQLDFITPGGEQPRPWVAVFHGGGWRAGAREDVHRELRLLAHLGFAAAAVSYRLVEGDQQRFPVAVADARCALRFLRRQSANLHLDPERGVALGYSAGGHLALMLGTADANAPLDDDCPDRQTSAAVRGVIAYFAPSDLRRSQDFAPWARRIVRRFLGRGEGYRSRARAASPITWVDPSDAPTLLLHGTDDPVVPIEQSERMARALRRAGVPQGLIRVPEARHGFRLVSRGAGYREAVCSALNFLQQVQDSTPETPTARPVGNPNHSTAHRP